MTTASTGWLRAGGVGSPHGLDGSFHVTDPKPELLPLGATVTVRLTGGSADAERELRIVRRAGTDRRPIVRLEGCADRAAAESLRGGELLVPRTAAPELGPDEWWAEDLEGCSVHDAGTAVGTVSRLLALPSCEVLEVERADGSGLLLVPLVSDAVRSVDIERQHIEIDLEFLGEA
jgi:16S rRNA processing protein RimM